MKKQKQMIIRINSDLFESAKYKCKDQYGIGLSPLIKIFLKSFVTQRGVGFFVGDADLRNIISRWLTKKAMEKGRKGCARLPGPRLKDLYDM